MKLFLFILLFGYCLTLIACNPIYEAFVRTSNAPIESEYQLLGWLNDEQFVVSLDYKSSEYKKDEYWLVEANNTTSKTRAINFALSSLPEGQNVQYSHMKKGPWYKYRIERTRLGMTCFSCGCGCYSHEKWFARRNLDFVHIFGETVEKEAQGLWTRNLTNLGSSAPDGRWKHIIKEIRTRQLIVSPSGCKVAYTNPEIEVTNIC